jgi:hypothetical protein
LDVRAFGTDFCGQQIARKAHQFLTLSHAIADIDAHRRDTITADLGSDDHILPREYGAIRHDAAGEFRCRQCSSSHRQRSWRSGGR